MKSVLWVIIIILVIWGISSLSGKNDTEAETIKIGFLGPLAGDLAHMGRNAQAAVSIAVEEINASGGVLGKSVEVIYEDDGCNGATAASAISKLINVDKVVAILGGMCSGATLGATPVAEVAKVPQLSYCSTSPAVTSAGDYIFRNVPSDLFQANFMASHLINIGKKNVALLTTKDDWGEGLKKAFTNSFSALGGVIVYTDSFDPASKNLKAQFTEIKSKNPDAIYFIAYTDPSIAGIKQARDLAITAPFFGADAWDDSKIWTELGTIGDGATFTAVSAYSSDEFKSKMKTKLGTDDIVYCSNYAYDGLKTLTDAIEKGGKTNGLSIKDALENAEKQDGSGKIFDENGDPASADYALKQVLSGRASEMTQ